MVAEDLVRGGVDGGPRLLRGWTIIQSSSSDFLEVVEVVFGGLPRRLGTKVVVDDEVADVVFVDEEAADVVFVEDEEVADVVFVEDFVSGFDNVVFLGRPRLLGTASVGGVALDTGFSLSIVTVSVLSPS